MQYGNIKSSASRDVDSTTVESSSYETLAFLQMILDIDLWLQFWNFKDTSIIELLNRIMQQFRLEETFGDYLVQTQLKAQMSPTMLWEHWFLLTFYQGVKSTL